MKDVTSRENRGKVNIRRNESRGKSRLRFTGMHDDQVELILHALANARSESATEYDSVALTNICMAYLAWR